NDMTNGVFLLDARAAYNTNTSNPVSVTSQKTESSLTVFPNPSAGSLHIRYPGEMSSVSVYNMLGERLPVPLDGSELNTSGLAPGTYVLEVVNALEVSRCRFIT